jgi:hypothetical protein
MRRGGALLRVEEIMTTTSVKKTIGNYADSVYYGISDAAG